MNCDCIQNLNDRLKEKNLKISASNFALSWPECETRFLVKTEWIDKAKAPKGKGKTPPPLFTSHCPHCGKPAFQEKKGAALAVEGNER